MTIEASGAVFLSYASQDGEAARRICEALRAAGIEVWFDQSELRGGDAWDQKIRRQIRDCALFIPIISTHTQTRTEGYFRLEWRLADQRTHLMARSRAYLVPVCIDDTPEADAEVPDSFSAVQWTRLPAGMPTPGFVDRVARLLSPDHPIAPDGSSASATATAQPAFTEPAKTRPPRWQSRPAVFLVVAMIVVSVGYLVATRYMQSGHSTPSLRETTPDSSAASPVPPGQSAIPEKSIAVLPFADLSEKKDQEYFSDGLSEELIDLLAKVPDLRVPARTSSFFFKGKTDDIATIAARLRVAQVLEGSVRKAGNTIRVSAQLVRADNGYHLWSETYDRDLKDVFKVQDEIAGAVVNALKLKLASGPQSSSSRRTSNTEAYTQFLLGRQFSERAVNVDDYRHAVAVFRKAIELDPGYAEAYAELAKAAASIADLAGDAASMRQAEAAAEKAVVLAPDQGYGYAARGDLRYSFARDWTGAQADFEKALEFDPADTAVQRGYGLLLASLGRLPEAIAATRKAAELDPLSSAAWANLGALLDEAGQSAAATDAYRKSLEIHPGNYSALYNLGSMQLRQGHAAEALATFHGSDLALMRLTGVAMAEHTLGHAQESQRALDELIATSAQFAAFQVALVYAWRGDKDQAFAWLDRAYRQHDGGMADIKRELILTPLRGDARYGELLKKMNLPQ